MLGLRPGPVEVPQLLLVLVVLCSPVALAGPSPVSPLSCLVLLPDISWHSSHPSSLVQILPSRPSRTHPGQHFLPRWAFVSRSIQMLGEAENASDGDKVFISERRQFQEQMSKTPPLPLLCALPTDHYF